MKISREKAREKLLSAENTMFSVVFIKRTTGEVRRMLCRTGVRKHLSGGELKFIPIRKGLLSVYDMQSKGYRFINLETLISFKLGGKTYEIQN